jgi:hypothetical protein
MTTNPFINAGLAVAYVAGIVSLISFGTGFVDAEQEDNILMPMAMISLLTLSTAVMAYLFFYQPVMLLLDGKRQEAVRLFLHTVALFAGFTVCIFLGAFLLFR